MVAAAGTTSAADATVDFSNVRRVSSFSLLEAVSCPSRNCIIQSSPGQLLASAKCHSVRSLSGRASLGPIDGNGRSGAQQSQIDTLCHRSETGVIGVQKVPGVECGKETSRFPRIAHDFVEVNHPVKRAAGANPVIDGLSYRFTRLRKNHRALERGDRGPERDDVMFMRPLGEL